MRACTSHARVVCTCCACPCCACQSCAFSCGVWCACAALVYIVWSPPTLHPRRPRRLAMPFTLSPFSVTYACSCHVIMHCSSLFAPFLACVVPSFYLIFYCILCSVPCLRLCLRKVAQVSLSAAEHPGHLISHTFPPRFAPFVPTLFSSCLAFFFAAKKKTRRPWPGGLTLHGPFLDPLQRTDPLVIKARPACRLRT